MSPRLILFLYITEWTRPTRHEETTETHSELSGSPQKWEKTHNNTSHVMFLQFFGFLLKQHESKK
jgi:hypothetical protein